MATQPSAAPFVFRGTFRQLQIPSCTLTTGNIRQLFQILSDKAKEAADRQIATLVKGEGQSDADFIALQERVRGLMKLSVRVTGANGQWSGGTVGDILNDEQLPDGITDILFDSAPMYRSTVNAVPDNSFSVNLNLRRNAVLDMSNPTKSVPITVSGVDATWANGVCEELRIFFSTRSNKRGWLHFAYTYDLLVLLVGIPLSLATVYLIDRLFAPSIRLPLPLTVALYVYLVLMVLYGFRVLFNYAKWVFPTIEIDAPGQRVAVGHKGFLGFLFLTCITLYIEALLRFFGVLK